jgi:trehalose 6-phosphate synthase/phosphatase
MEARRLAVISNRLPIVVNRNDAGEWSISPGSGGLVTALGPVLRDRGGLWIGWLGTTSEDIQGGSGLDGLLSRGAAETGYALKPVHLKKEEVQKFYLGFSNEILWPLFHDFPTRCNFDPCYWRFYEQVNKKYAEAVLEHTHEDDYVWVHDYQLILVADELSKIGGNRHMGFFLHIPFPPLDVFLRLPWRSRVLDALLRYDLVGFQTARDRKNFIECALALIPRARVYGRGTVCRLITPDCQALVGAFPISIDFKGFAEQAATEEVASLAWVIHEKLPNRQLIFGVDRLDYTKGIPNRLHAFAKALELYPELRGKVSLVQVVVPSRESIREYDLLKQDIERLVGEINGQYTEVGWIPITYIFRSLRRVELLAYYRTCEIALVTPLKDGMNLVAKEYCASNIEETGVLILSEFAGAAAQLHHAAILVNPYDVDGVAHAIRKAFSMDAHERKAKMKSLRRSIFRHDIFVWVNSFLRASIAKDLNSFPQIEYFVPLHQPRANDG